MAIPQGSTVVNTAYFTGLAHRAAAAKSCAELQAMNTNVTASVNATIGSATAQIAAVTTQITNIGNQISKLTSHIGTLAASQASTTAVGTVAATAAAVSDLGSAIAYIKAQGLVLVGFGTTNTASFVQQALALGADLTAIQHDYDLITSQLANLNAQVTGITSALTGLQSAITSAAAAFPGCTI